MGLSRLPLLTLLPGRLKLSEKDWEIQRYSYNMYVIELQYLPQPAYIAQFLLHNELFVDGYEHYVKQTYRNRCRILSANGVDELSVPVHGSGKRIASKDIRIDHSQKWLNRHWRAIQSAYGRAPYFEYYAEDYLRIYEKEHTFLFDFSLELLTQCLENLHFDLKLRTTEQYFDLTDRPQNDLRGIISPNSASQKGVSYKQVSYQQVFGNNFVDNLSILDLIFCTGPQAGDIIKSAIK